MPTTTLCAEATVSYFTFCRRSWKSKLTPTKACSTTPLAAACSTTPPGGHLTPGGPRRVLVVDDSLLMLSAAALGQRRQRHGDRQRLADADQEGRPLSEPLAQRAHQRRLADARLAGHEHELAAPVARRLHDRLQRRQLLAAFQQRIHAAILVAAWIAPPARRR